MRPNSLYPTYASLHGNKSNRNVDYTEVSLSPGNQVEAPTMAAEEITTSSASSMNREINSEEESQNELSSYITVNIPTKASSKTTIVFDIDCSWKIPGNDATCSICYLEKKNTWSVILHYGHQFHKMCVINWIRRKGTDTKCPNCRAYVNPTNVIPWST